MAKKKSKKPATPSGDVPVQYRPGHLLGDLLDKLSSDWGVSRNETAKRLSALAAHDLDARHHDLICEYAEKMYGQNDFIEACQRVHIELQSADTERVSRGHAAMTEDQRQEHIEQVVRVFAVMYRNPEQPEEEEQRIQIFRTS